MVAAEAPGGLGADELRTLALDVRGRLSPDRPGVVAVLAARTARSASSSATNEAARLRGLSAPASSCAAGRRALGGRGGGKDDVAQGGGTEPDGIPEALLLVEHAVGQRLS